MFSCICLTHSIGKFPTSDHLICLFKGQSSKNFYDHARITRLKFSFQGLKTAYLEVQWSTLREMRMRIMM